MAKKPATHQKLRGSVRGTEEAGRDTGENGLAGWGKVMVCVINRRSLQQEMDVTQKPILSTSKYSAKVKASPVQILTASKSFVAFVSLVLKGTDREPRTVL